MIKADFKDLDFFTYKEVKDTGADMANLKKSFMIRFDNFRRALGLKIGLVINGLNSGNHMKNSMHYISEAIDWFLLDIKVDPYTLLKIIHLAGAHGFNGVGVYLNHETGYIGFHFDTRTVPAFWTGIKSKTKDKWSYDKMGIELA